MFRTLELGGCPKVQRSDAKTKLWPSLIKLQIRVRLITQIFRPNGNWDGSLIWILEIVANINRHPVQSYKVAFLVFAIFRLIPSIRFFKQILLMINDA